MTWLSITVTCVATASFMLGFLAVISADRALRWSRIPIGIVAYSVLAMPAFAMSLYCVVFDAQPPRWWSSLGKRLMNWIADDEPVRRVRDQEKRREDLDREIAAAEEDRLQALLELRQALLDHRQALVELRKEIAEEESKAIDRLLERTQSQDPKELN